MLTPTNLARIAHLCASFDVDGMRADLVIARTAVAHAAWSGRETVEDEDIRVAAELALPHRRRRDPFDEPGLDQEQLDEAMDEARDQHPEPESEENPQVEPPESTGESDEPTSDGEAGSADNGAPFRS